MRHSELCALRGNHITFRANDAIIQIAGKGHRGHDEVQDAPSYTIASDCSLVLRTLTRGKQPEDLLFPAWNKALALRSSTRLRPNLVGNRSRVGFPQSLAWKGKGHEVGEQRSVGDSMPRSVELGSRDEPVRSLVKVASSYIEKCAIDVRVSRHLEHALRRKSVVA